MSPRVGFFPDLWFHHLSLCFVDSNAPGAGGASGRWQMTTIRLSPMGPSTCCLLLPWQQRPAIPELIYRARAVRMSLWEGQELLTDPCNSVSNARLLKRAAKITALHRSIESFRCHGHAWHAPEAKPALRGQLCMSSSVPGTGQAEQGSWVGQCHHLLMGPGTRRL